MPSPYDCIFILSPPTLLSPKTSIFSFIPSPYHHHIFLLLLSPSASCCVMVQVGGPVKAAATRRCVTQGEAV